MIEIKLPEAVKNIINILEQAGFEAYAVGGCVRDSILGREPNDWDITTSAKPLETKALFRRTIDTGIQHGTITIMDGNNGYEVTTYRIDGEYEDARHPKEVTFTACLNEDLARRDFTINAMAYNDRVGLVDLYNGIQDIQNKIIRAVGEPEKRFEEDALRIMRAVRFAAQLGYDIDKGTKSAIKQFAPNLKKISAERIQTELVKLVTSNNPDFLRIAYETGITEIILPEFNRAIECEQNHPHHIYNVGEHCLQAMKHVRADKVLRLTMLMHDIGKPLMLTIDDDGKTHFKGHAAESEKIADAIFERLKFDNDTRRKVKVLTFFHDVKISLTDRGVRRMVNKVGEELFPLLLEVKLADVMAQSDYMRKEKLDELDLIHQIYEQVLESNSCLSLKQLAVKGGDLIAAGVKPGVHMGEILNQMLEYVLDYPEDNNKEVLLKKFVYPDEN